MSRSFLLRLEHVWRNYDAPLHDGNKITASAASHILLLLLEENDVPAGDGIAHRTILNRIKHMADRRTSLLDLSLFPALLQEVCLETVSMHMFQKCVGVDLLPTSSQGRKRATMDNEEDQRAVVPYRPDITVDYSTWQRESLVTMVEANSVELATYEKELRLATKTNTDLETALEETQTELQAARKAYADLKDLTYFRVGTRRVSAFGGYQMASKRRFGHVGAKSLVQMMASEQHQGALVAGDAVINFEHNLIAVHRILTEEHHTNNIMHLKEDGGGFEVTSYMGDATNEGVCQQEKVHVGLLGYAAAYEETFDKFYKPEPDGIETKETFADLQIVREGTADETIGIMLKQFRSVELPCWLERAVRPLANVFSVFGFSLDAGPDNTGGVPRIKTTLERFRHVACFAIFCLHHQDSLMSLAGTHVASEWAFDTMPDNSNTKFVTTVSQVSNTWRAPGGGRRLWDVVSKTYDATIANEIAGHTPGKVVRTRWGSLHEVSGTIVRGGRPLAICFPLAFEPAAPKAKAKAKPSAGLMGDVDDVRREEARQCKVTASKFFKSDAKKVKCVANYIGQGPLQRFRLWEQKQTALFNKKQQQKLLNAEVGLEAPFIKLVDSKAAEIEAMFTKLLLDENESMWEALWDVCPGDVFKEEGRELALAIVLNGAGQWEMRIMKKVRTFPWRMFACAAKPNETDDPLRRIIADELLTSDRADLEDKFSDLTLKILDWFVEDWRLMRDTGKITKRLRALLLTIAVMVRSDTQRIEGANSVLQKIIEAATNIHIPLASDRLGIKLNDPVPVQTCVGRHKEAVTWRKDDDRRDRFSIIDANEENAKLEKRLLDQDHDDVGNVGPEVPRGSQEDLPEPVGLPPLPPPAVLPGDGQVAAAPAPAVLVVAPAAIPAEGEEEFDEEECRRKFAENLKDTCRSTECNFYRSLAVRPGHVYETQFDFVSRDGESLKVSLHPFVLTHSYAYDLWAVTVDFINEGAMVSLQLPLRPYRLYDTMLNLLKEKTCDTVPPAQLRRFKFQRVWVTTSRVKYLSSYRRACVVGTTIRSFAFKKAPAKKKPRHEEPAPPPAIADDAPPDAIPESEEEEEEGAGGAAAMDGDVDEDNIDDELFEYFGVGEHDDDGHGDDHGLGVGVEVDDDIIDEVFKDKHETDEPVDVKPDVDDDDIIAPREAAAKVMTLTMLQRPQRATMTFIKNEAKKEWAENHVQYQEARDKAKRQETAGLELEWHSLSVVRCRRGGDLTSLIVRWEKPGVSARPVRLDEYDRLIFELRPPEDLHELVILVRDIGMKLDKVKKHERCVATPWCLKLMRAEDCWLFAGPLVDVKCAACVAAARAPKAIPAPADGILPNDASVFKCYTCMVPWHIECHELLANEWHQRARDPIRHDIGDTQCLMFQCCLCEQRGH